MLHWKCLRPQESKHIRAIEIANTLIAAFSSGTHAVQSALFWSVRSLHRVNAKLNNRVCSHLERAAFSSGYTWVAVSASLEVSGPSIESKHIGVTEIALTLNAAFSSGYRWVAVSAFLRVSGPSTESKLKIVLTLNAAFSSGYTWVAVSASLEVSGPSTESKRNTLPCATAALLDKELTTCSRIWSVLLRACKCEAFVG